MRGITRLSDGGAKNCTFGLWVINPDNNKTQFACVTGQTPLLSGTQGRERRDTGARSLTKDRKTARSEELMHMSMFRPPGSHAQSHL